MKGLSWNQATECSAKVRSVYLDLQSRPIARNCQLRTGCCHFQQTGLVPQLTPAEAIVAAKALKATGRKGLPAGNDGACPMLNDESRCLIYEDRPFGCRTHFCEAAGGPYSRREVIDLIRRLEEASEGLSQEMSRPLGAAMEDALESLPEKPKKSRRR